MILCYTSLSVYVCIHEHASVVYYNVCVHMLVRQTLNTDSSVNFILLIETVYFNASETHPFGKSG